MLTLGQGTAFRICLIAGFKPQFDTNWLAKAATRTGQAGITFWSSIPEMMQRLPRNDFGEVLIKRPLPC
jgi:hypothetical protein